MEFDIKRVYTSVNADEVKIGSKVIAANNIDSLKCKVYDGDDIGKVKKILEASYERRFQLDCNGTYPFVYLISPPEEKKLKWTDLKIGDVIKRKSNTYKYMVICVDTDPEENHHICTLDWISDAELSENWEKVEE